MGKRRVLIGLDVHQRQTVAAVLLASTGELSTKRLRVAPEGVVDFLAGFDEPIRAVYEAGPSGFGLARAAAARGLDVQLVAPGSIPRGTGDRVKTDKRDAERLVRLLAAGELSFAFIPSEADERFRDLVRCIEDARADLMRVRHRLSKFLLRQGLRFGGPGGAWTQAHLHWIGSLRLEDPCSAATLLDYQSAVQQIVQRRSALHSALEQAIPTSSHAKTIAALRCFRGIDTLTAAGLAAEIGDFHRFEKPTLLSGFLGLVPSERTSDIKRRQGAITKAGPSHARRLLVESAHHYRRRPNIGPTLQRRQAGQDPRVVAVAWRAQRRLNQRWEHLYGQRRKPSGVVTIAVARELAAFCWEAATID